ncbi:hypothetical protein GGR56DRAFT_627117 [Xylariaceae sp. FL0804]|nr:hypothetical protein GGR56DRAFT_627117 [Xylariaceae sp. FL0804]
MMRTATSWAVGINTVLIELSRTLGASTLFKMASREAHGRLWEIDGKRPRTADNVRRQTDYHDIQQPLSDRTPGDDPPSAGFVGNRLCWLPPWQS